MDPNSVGHSEWIQAQGPIKDIHRSLRDFASPMLKIMRVSQLDTELLDQELLGMLKEQLWSALSLFKSNLREKFEPELIALLDLVMFRYSIFENSATYGAMLQNLRYRNEARHSGGLQSTATDAPLTVFQKVAYGLLTVGGKYGFAKLNNTMTNEGWGELTETNIRKKIWKAVQAAEKVYHSLTLVNFLLFLYNGKYRTIVDRLLRMRLVYAQRTSSRQISFEFLNRQLVWHAFTEFLLFIVPLINTRKMRSRLKRLLLPKSLTAPKAKLGFLPLHICPICHEREFTEDPLKAGAMVGTAASTDTSLNNPYTTNCGHRYCYYCIESKLQTEEDWACLRCGEVVKTIERSTIDDVLPDNVALTDVNETFETVDQEQREKQV